jgi:hypothetical protein
VLITLNAFGLKEMGEDRIGEQERDNGDGKNKRERERMRWKEKRG